MYPAVGRCCGRPYVKLKLAFSEEFDGAALDPAKWTFEGGTAAISLKAGKLVIALTERPDGWQGSGVSTRDKFTQAFGYFEASIRFNAQRGHHGGFMLRTRLPLSRRRPRSITSVLGKINSSPGPRSVIARVCGSFAQ